jgi:glutamate-1-semialdehyde 2,1-aminomutase
MVQSNPLAYAAVVAAVAAGVPWAWRRLELSFAKHRSLTGHARWSRRLARIVPHYDYDESEFFRADGADDALASQRRSGFFRLAEQLRSRQPAGIELTGRAEPGISDLQFVNRYRVPFQFAAVARRHLKSGSFVSASTGVRIVDVDGNESYDLAGSYGVNLFGYDFYKQCIELAVIRAGALGPVLGAYHPVVVDNVTRLQRISGLDEVSFHMSGTEAVMQAVRLARYHTRRSHVVRFCGSYHGWWGDVQPGIGNPMPAEHTYTLADMSDAAIRVLETRGDVACVLVNPLQALHPNKSAPSDSTLVAAARSVGFDRELYTAWLQRLREVCTRRGIALVFDEVFLGFRLARGGAQQYFGVQADLVTYGKTLGGGLPVGVLCGRADLMRRFREDRPADVCFARGTFNAHPYVMLAMNEFLVALDEDRGIAAAYDNLDATWRRRAEQLNAALGNEGLPVYVRAMSTVWVVCHSRPSRYHWMLQYYLRAAGLALSWVGTGRCIFSLNYTDDDFAEVVRRFVAAARQMQDDGWWTEPPGFSGAAVRQRVLLEMLRVRLGLPAISGRRGRPPGSGAAGQAAPCDRA